MAFRSLHSLSYQLRLPYLHRPDGASFPGLIVDLQHPESVTSAVEIRAELDSGAEYSLFQGALATAVGLDLFGGERFAFTLASGAILEARILPIVLSHAELGRFGVARKIQYWAVATQHS